VQGNCTQVERTNPFATNAPARRTESHVSQRAAAHAAAASFALMCG